MIDAAIFAKREKLAAGFGDTFIALWFGVWRKIQCLKTARNIGLIMRAGKNILRAKLMQFLQNRIAGNALDLGFFSC